ncbi:MAG: TPM domain-containing protein [Lactobacillales bacterium]|nr:TPM domain-containing protein [Lactobacillales bacterium]
MKKFKLFLVLFLALFININSIKADLLTSDTTTPIIENTVEETTKERTEENNYGVNKDIKINSNNLYNIKNTPYVDASKKVYDFANILSESEEQTIYSYSKEFMDATGMEMIFVTVDMPYTYDSKHATYASDFYDYNDFGLDLEHYDGILLLRNNYSYDRYYDMYTFGKAQLYFNQSRYDDVLDSIYSEISNDRYLDGFKEFKDKCLNYYNQGISSKYKNAYIDENGFIKYNYSVPYVLGLGIAAVSTLITMLILVNKNKMIKRATKAAEYMDKKSVNYSVKNDRFITSRTTSYTVSSSSGGGSRGGSSGRGFSSGGGRHG